MPDLGVARRGAARRVILQTLALLGITPGKPAAPTATPENLRLIGVTDKEHAGDLFTKKWRSFDAVKAGGAIGVRYSGVEAKAQGDGFCGVPQPAR